MTNAQDAKLAREAEMAFASISLATDYDCWHDSDAEVSVEDVVKVMHDNVETARRILVKTLQELPSDFPNSQENALQFALITDRAKISDRAKKDLAPLIGRYLEAN